MMIILKNLKSILAGLNYRVIAEGVILFSISGLFFYLFITDLYLNYIHPRYKFYLLAAAFILMILSFFRLNKIKYYTYKNSYRHFGILLFPFFIFLLLIDSPFSALSSFPLYAEQNFQNLNKVNIGTVDKNQSLQVNNESGKNAVLGESQNLDSAENLPIIKNSIRINTSDYASFIWQVFNDVKPFVDKRYGFLAYVQKSDYLNESYYLLGRPVMICCAADSQSVGLFSLRYFETDKGEKLDLHNYEGTWVYVSGRIKENRGVSRLKPETFSPVLEILDIRPAPKPASIYSYYSGEKEINNIAD